jgi:hypothetical protein
MIIGMIKQVSQFGEPSRVERTIWALLLYPWVG